MTLKLKDQIGFDFRTGQYVVASHDLTGQAREQAALQASYASQADVDSFLAQLSRPVATSLQDHQLLAQTIVEPIEQVIPYVEMYNIFYMEQNYGEIEDNRIPIEDTVALAWETHQDGQILYTRSGYSWTRPDFTTFDTGIEVAWGALKKAGWNFVARQMKRATEELARKRDGLARGALIAAIPASHEHNVTGGALTQAIVNTVLKAQAALGYPVVQVLINPSTLMDMAAFAWNGTNFRLPPEEARQLLRTLYLMDYGGAKWFTNHNFPTNEVLLAGTPDQIGWHQTRGSVTVSADVNITRGVDLHAIRDKEHAYYVGNANSLARIRIGA
jgi:hypothetical protein